MRLAILSVAVTAAVLATTAAHAHHSYGMFDRQKELTVSGTVEEFQWTNPHSRVVLVAPGSDGPMTKWDVEMGPPGQLVRTGWNRLSLKPGDKVDILMNPLREGKSGGHLLMVTTTDGKKLYDVIFKKPEDDKKTK